MQISFLELLDVGVGPKGALALGQSLSKGKNLSLCTLKLDYNVSLGAEGNFCQLLFSLFPVTLLFFNALIF